MKQRRSILPGFGISTGFTLVYISLLVLIPLACLFVRAASMTWADFLHTVTSPRALAAYRVSFGCAFIAACINLVFGTIVAWVLVRYPFPGRRIVDALVDLPFALPTSVAGITLTAMFAKNGWLGEPLQRLSIDVAYTPLGIIVALTFIGLPFVVRTLEPVLQDLRPEFEEAASTLGASRFQAVRDVLLPETLPAILTGFTLAFARATGEYGSVIFISGNMPMKTEIAPLLIVTKLEQFDYAGATALAAVMLVLSFALLLCINFLQTWSARRLSHAR